ncbi:MAG: hypothetical protein HFI81_06380 [Eubacterium sp.]|nr:hypothetical protein [Eubacterium sp.]
MKLEEFLYNIVKMYGTAEFSYKGKTCGVEPETNNSITTYCMWYGKVWKDYKGIDDLMTDRFFDGRSLTDILPEIDVWF